MTSTDRSYEAVDFWEAARQQLLCAQCDRATRNWDAHHVIEKQELRRRGFDEWDPRNALRLCSGPLSCHAQHTGAAKRVDLKNLTDENLDYAFWALGAYAYDYLHRRYDGQDERLVRYLRTAETRESFHAVS